MVLVLLGCGTSWGTAFTFTDNNGQWGSGNGGITVDWSSGLSVTGVSSSGSGLVTGALDTDWSVFLGLTAPYYTLDATVATGPVIGVSALVPGLSGVVGLSPDLFVAWDVPTTTLMFFAGNPLASYAYLGLDLDANAFGGIDWSTVFCDGCGTTQIALSGDIDAIYSRNCVPIPGAVWLLGSGLLGLVGIRRKKKA